MLFLLNLKKVQKVASTMRIFDKTKTPRSNSMPSLSIFFKQFNNGRSLSYLSVLKILVYKCVFGLIQKLKIKSQWRHTFNARTYIAWSTSLTLFASSGLGSIHFIFLKIKNR